MQGVDVESIVTRVQIARQRDGHGPGKKGQKMQRTNESEWFCANCLQMIEMLSRHGRCPYCDSNAVDVEYRWRRSEAEVRPEVVLSINA